MQFPTVSDHDMVVENPYLEHIYALCIRTCLCMNSSPVSLCSEKLHEGISLKVRLKCVLLSTSMFVFSFQINYDIKQLFTETAVTGSVSLTHH